ncbi:c-type cytochrome biogenesis protein CcmI [Meridianimarinicoccus sp. MJW13]|uniref:c-type cytochrome biogenesis protein CcmI n=1 Tax=Meridianimarinicoccus sp. MJW13 TaxID=2720031 RepID=UPI001867A376|nr:c-type cytochrome biogenesis protein CcmI [Fluviibacterium sp. MJW13]
MMFWILTSALALASAVLLALALLRRPQSAPDRAEYDIAVYRDQLKGVERDLARGVISEEVAGRTRTEVKRRILEADKARSAHVAPGTAPRGVTLALIAVLGLVLGGGSFAAYLKLGAPGFGDLPLKTRIENAQTLRETRPSQSEAEARAEPLPGFPERDPQFVKLVEQLRTTVADRPDDPRGFELLANNEAALGNFSAAHKAQARLIELRGADASAADYITWADLMVIATNGYVSPEAEAALNETLKRDPHNGPARYYIGLMHAQTGRPDMAFRIWKPLLEESTPDAPWLPAIRGQIEELAFRAGIDYRLPEAAPLGGPSAEDMDAAAEMSPEERMEMIRSMVEGLSERLASEGGAPSEWARLITALGVLGETGRANAIYAESKQVFDGNAAALNELAEAARRAEILQ